MGKELFDRDRLLKALYSGQLGPEQFGHPPDSDSVQEQVFSKMNGLKSSHMGCLARFGWNGELAIMLFGRTSSNFRAGSGKYASLYADLPESAFVGGVGSVLPMCRIWGNEPFLEWLGWVWYEKKIRLHGERSGTEWKREK
jgi:hypothetical protein